MFAVVVHLADDVYFVFVAGTCTLTDEVWASAQPVTALLFSYSQLFLFGIRSRFVFVCKCTTLFSYKDEKYAKIFVKM